MQDLKRNEVERQLRYTYTQQERIQKGVNLAEKLGDLAQLDAELSRVKKDYGNRIDAAQAQADALSDQVRTGFEMRAYVCFWEFDTPAKGKKTLRRKDTGEVVEESEMSMADCQTVMEEIDPATSTPELLAFPAEASTYPNPYPPIVDIYGGTQEEEWFRQWLSELFFDGSNDPFPPEDFDNCQREQIAAMVEEEDIQRLISFLQWLEQGYYPHCAQAASVLRNHPDFRAKVGDLVKWEGEQVKAAKKARKPRAVSSGGVVGTAEDGDINTPDEDRKNS